MTALSHAGPRSIVDVLASHARTRPRHPFLVWEPAEGPARTWTYAELDDHVRRVAAGLRRRGVRPGDRVLIHLENCPEFVHTWLACARIGAIAVTTNTRSAAHELRDLVVRTAPRLAVTQPGLSTVVDEAGGGFDVVVTPTDAGRPAADGTQSSISDGYDRLASGDRDDAAAPAPDALFSCQFTSGTTSRPKGVLWTHANAVWGAHVSAVHQSLRPDDVHLVTNPLFHTNAQTWSLLPALWVGATAVLTPGFSVRRFWPVSVRNRCTWASVTNFTSQTLRPLPVPEHHYRLWGNAVSSPPEDAYFGVKTIGWWGMTETITQCIVAEAYQENRSGSMGRPSPFYEVDVRDEAGRSVQAGDVGELFVRGRRGLSLFREYLDDPAATATAFDEDGWLITGDAVRLEDDGSITFSDRLKDMIKTGGENVAASEVETTIRAVAGIEDVTVVGQPHALYDEVPVAFVIPAPDAPADLERRVLEACAAALSDFKIPWDVRTVEDFPRSVLRKVAKAELREQLPTLSAAVRRRPPAARPG